MVSTYEHQRHGNRHWNLALSRLSSKRAFEKTKSKQHLTYSNNSVKDSGTNSVIKDPSKFDSRNRFPFRMRLMGLKVQISQNNIEDQSLDDKEEIEGAGIKKSFKRRKGTVFFKRKSNSINQNDPSGTFENNDECPVNFQPNKSIETPTHMNKEIEVNKLISKFKIKSKSKNVGFFRKMGSQEQSSLFNKDSLLEDDQNMIEIEPRRGIRKKTGISVKIEESESYSRIEEIDVMESPTNLEQTSLAFLSPTPNIISKRNGKEIVSSQRYQPFELNKGKFNPFSSMKENPKKSEFKSSNLKSSFRGIASSLTKTNVLDNTSTPTLDPNIIIAKAYLKLLKKVKPKKTRLISEKKAATQTLIEIPYIKRKKAVELIDLQEDNEKIKSPRSPISPQIQNTHEKSVRVIRRETRRKKLRIINPTGGGRNFDGSAKRSPSQEEFLKIWGTNRCGGLFKKFPYEDQTEEYLKAVKTVQTPNARLYRMILNK